MSIELTKERLTPSRVKLKEADLAGASKRQRQMLMAYTKFYRALRGAGYWCMARSNWGLTPFNLRKPSSDERRAAQTLAARVDKVSVAGDTLSTKPVAIPPGRIRHSRMVQQRIQLSRGMQPTALPFDRRTVAHAPRTPVSVGFIFDISLSMDAMARLGSSLAWVTADAVTRVDGKVAAVAFSRAVHPMIAPGEHSSVVQEFTVIGGQHCFPEALLSVDAALNLIDGDGARVLVVFSDGQFSQPEYTPWLDEAIEKGVIVVWVTDSALPAEVSGGVRDIVISPWSTTVGEVATLVGDSIVEAAERHKGLRR